MSYLITGITGQDGSYLYEQLAAQGRNVVGTISPHEPILPDYFKAFADSDFLTLESCDLSEPTQFRNLLRHVNPTHVFHLAALSSPAQCAKNPDLSRKVNVTSLDVLLDWARRDNPSVRILAISSAAVFGNPKESPQNESTPMAPLNEYGRQKMQVREIADQARADGLFVATAIPFNHESERRPESFVIAKIAWGVARVKLGIEPTLKLGDVSPRRDWGYAPEYAQALGWMLDVDTPLELILATGEAHSVKEAVELALDVAGLPINSYESDLSLRQPGDPQDSIGDSARAWVELGWEPRTKFSQLIPRLVKFALDTLRK